MSKQTSPESIEEEKLGYPRVTEEFKHKVSKLLRTYEDTSARENKFANAVRNGRHCTYFRANARDRDLEKAMYNATAQLKDKLLYLKDRGYFPVGEKKPISILDSSIRMRKGIGTPDIVIICTSESDEFITFYYDN